MLILKRLLFSVLAALLTTGAWAQLGTSVQGHVQDSLGNPLANQLVYYQISDSLTGPVLVTGQIGTNALGNYYDSILIFTPTTNALFAEVWTIDCQGNTFFDSSLIPLTALPILDSFMITVCPPPSCNSGFTASYNSITNEVEAVANTPGLVYSWTNFIGATGINQNFSFTSAAPYYTVFLTTTDSVGSCIDTLTQGVYTICDAAFTSTYDTVSGGTITSVPNMTGLMYSWVSSTGTSGGSPTFSFSASVPGVYTVTLTVQDSFAVCTDTEIDTIIVTPPCDASFNVSIAGNNVTCTPNMLGLVYNWASSTGATSGGQNFLFTAPAGTHTIELQVTDSTGACMDTTFQVITIAPQCNSGFNAWSLNDSTYAYQAFDTALLHTWTVDGVPVGTVPLLTYNFGATNQSYQVCLIVEDTNSGCTDTTCITTTVTITPPIPCDASFSVTDSVWGNPATQEFYFFPTVSNVFGRTYTWFFGDGNSEQANWPGGAIHRYDSTGTYTVCLSVGDSACIDTVCQTITVLHPGYGSINGNVFADSNYADTIMALADAATIYLIEYTSSAGSGILTAVDSTSTQTGSYSFQNVPAGDYLIKGALNPISNVYSRFIPAYYATNSFPGVLNWASGSTVSVGNSPGWTSWGRDVHLIYGNNPGGPGFIGGLVSQGANKTSGPGDPLEGILVMLLDLNGKPVKYTYSDANGEFAFDNLSLGTYTIYTDIPGLVTDPSTLTLTTNYQREELVQVEVNSSYIETYIGTVNSITDETSDRAIRLFPVPAGDHLNLEFGSDWSQEAVSIRMYDMTGKEIRSWTKQANGLVTLNLQGIDAGIYVIRVDSGSNVAVYSIMK